MFLASAFTFAPPELKTWPDAQDGGQHRQCSTRAVTQDHMHRRSGQKAPETKGQKRSRHMGVALNSCLMMSAWCKLHAVQVCKLSASHCKAVAIGLYLPRAKSSKFLEGRDNKKETTAYFFYDTCCSRLSGCRGRRGDQGGDRKIKTAWPPCCRSDPPPRRLTADSVLGIETGSKILRIVITDRA